MTALTGQRPQSKCAGCKQLTRRGFYVRSERKGADPLTDVLVCFACFMRLVHESQKVEGK